MKQRGKRIRPSGKDLVFHFTIASLLPVFLLVVGLFHAKKSPFYLATICLVSVLSLLVVELRMN